jgi:hypothetical protein
MTSNTQFLPVQPHSQEWYQLRGIVVAGFTFRKNLEQGIKTSESATYHYHRPEIIQIWRELGLY